MEDARLLVEKIQAEAGESLIAQEKDEADKKKAKMADFTEGSAVPDNMLASTSKYAILQIATFDHIEQW